MPARPPRPSSGAASIWRRATSWGWIAAASSAPTLYPQTTVSAALAAIPQPRNGAGLHGDPATGTLVGVGGTGVYRLPVGPPARLTILASGSARWTRSTATLATAST